jgi:hypothetical protein
MRLDMVGLFLSVVPLTSASGHLLWRSASLVPPEQPAAPVERDDLTRAAGYGMAPLGLGPCLTSGESVVGSGQQQFCIDVPGAASDGTKLVLSVDTPRIVDTVRIGERSFARAQSNLTTRGPILEVKPFQQSCEVCDTCACIGCGSRCECSCTALCRLRHESSCSHTAGVLTPGRWYVGVDAVAAFTLRATLVGALALRPGVSHVRTLSAVGARRDASASAAAALDGAAFADYFFYEPAAHESMLLTVQLLRASSAASHVEVFVRFGGRRGHCNFTLD